MSCFKIKELRKRAGMTQTELAQRLKIKSSSTICMWETGERTPPSKKLPDIARALHTSIESLYRDDL